MLRQGARNVRYGGLPFVFSTLMTTLGLFALAMFATVLLNFSRVADSVGRSIGMVAFLDVQSAADAEQVRAELSFLPGVKTATLVTPEAAMAQVKETLRDGDVLLESAAGVKMPWIVELALRHRPDMDYAQMKRAVEKVQGVDEALHPGGELKRIEALAQLLSWGGLFLTVLIAMAVVVMVSNTIKLTLYVRREEIAIMKLVGATDAYVRVPFLIEGLVQGLVAGVLAVVALFALHHSVAGVMKTALSGALGTFELQPLPPIATLWVVLAGALLGAFGAGLSLGRFLRV